MPTIAAALAAASILIGGAGTVTFYGMDQVFLIEVGADYVSAQKEDQYYKLCDAIARFPPGKVPASLRERAINLWNLVNSIRAKRGQGPIPSCHR